MPPSAQDEVIEIGSSDDNRARKPKSARPERLNTTPSFKRFAHPSQSGPTRTKKPERPPETVDLTQDDDSTARKRLDKLFVGSGRAAPSDKPAKTTPVDLTKRTRESGSSKPRGPTLGSQQPSSRNHRASSPVIVDSDDEGETAHPLRHASSTSGTRVPGKPPPVPVKDASKKRARESRDPDVPDKRARLSVLGNESKAGSQERSDALRNIARVAPELTKTEASIDIAGTGLVVAETPRSSKATRVEQDQIEDGETTVASSSMHTLLKVAEDDDNGFQKATGPRRHTPPDQASRAHREASGKGQPGSADTNGVSSNNQLETQDANGPNFPPEKPSVPVKGSSNGKKQSRYDGVQAQGEKVLEIFEPGRPKPKTLGLRIPPAAAIIDAPNFINKVGEKRKEHVGTLALETELAQRQKKSSLNVGADVSNFLGTSKASFRQPGAKVAKASEASDRDLVSLNDELSAQIRSEMAAAEARPPPADPVPPSARQTPTIDSKMGPPPAPNGFGTPAVSGFPLSRQVELSVGKHLAAMREDTGYHGKMWMKRARRSKKVVAQPPNPDAVLEEAPNAVKRRPLADSIFASMKPIQPLTTGVASGKPAPGDGSIRVHVETAPGTPKAAKSTQVFRPTDVATLKNEDVPGYAHYVSLQSNMLAPNTMTMNVWPYLGDDEPQGSSFDQVYYVDVEQRPRKLKRLLQAQKAEEYAEMALKDLDISWNDVLRVLLDPSPDVGEIDDAKKLLANRKAFVQEDVPQSSEKWTKLLSNLATSDQVSLSKALFLCHSFQRLAGFALWHIARRCDIVKQDLARQDVLPTEFEERTCRVCLRFNCHLHGELREIEESDDDIGYESDTAVATDIIHPQNVNYRIRLPFRPSPNEDLAAISGAVKSGNKKHSRYWDADAYKDKDKKPPKRGPFYPCDHPGLSCDDAGKSHCSCRRNDIPCEKTCTCPTSCPHKFAGCSCSVGKTKRPGEFVCLNDDRCACFQAGRECDPDLCGSCGSCDVVDPVNRYDDTLVAGKCRNAVMQRGVPKRTLLGDSGVHGMGLYAGENIQRHEFVGEYKGEVITSEEGQRRGAVYDSQRLSYLFRLNEKQDVDGTYYGNKMRFINHRSVNENVYARTFMVNTVHRIALYAARPIKAGEELFFNYGEEFPDEKLGGKAKIDKSVPHLRNSKHLEGFYEIEEVEDDVGNVRARKAVGEGRPRGRPKKAVVAAGDTVAKPAPKKRGGARPGAGRKPRKAVVGENGMSALEPAADAEQIGGGQSKGDRYAPERRLADYYLTDERPAGDYMDEDVPPAIGEADDDDEDFDPEEDDEEESYSGDSE